MSTTTAVSTARPTAHAAASAAPRTAIAAAFATLVRRRLLLSARTPRETIVPLMTPVLFALVVAPALDSIGPTVAGLDYMSFAMIGTAVLLIPINCMFAGVGVFLDRETGARRDLLAAPIPRWLIVLATLVVALAITALQVVVLLTAAVVRGAELDVSASGFAWFVAVFAAALTAVAIRTFRRAAVQ